ncbi:MAG TPA: beta-N-acetylhexosaminidase [Ktedonobacteraceae bacterium]|jgi:beta-N-acetylhexosaminidase|nr:beta-N-acetylhexosaminidase [Ktedonobacteraceae bacterium]
MQHNNHAGLTLEEQLGQIMVVGFPGHTVTPEVVDLIQKYHVGNIILFSRNIENAEQLRALTQHLQQLAREAGQRYPLLIMLDQENGVVRRLGRGTTIFPGNMTQGAINSEQMSYDIALATGHELKALGINMNLAPVVDVNNNPANPVIGVRSFGEDPQLVARLGAAAVRGYRDAGIITSLKHFPGHGDTATDSHLALPVVPYTLERLQQVELLPFTSGIAAGATSIMIAHMYIPELMQQSNLPSTISPEIVTGLLRQRLGYNGVIITDCLEMNAVANTVGTAKGALMALQAGNDLILISHTYEQQLGGLNEIKQAALADSRTTEQLAQAAERVVQIKRDLLSWDDLPATDVIENQAHQQLRDQAYELSTTLVRDEQHLLPLQLAPDQSLLVLLLQPTFNTRVVDQEDPGYELARQVALRHANTHTMHLSEQQTSQEAVLNAVQRSAATIVVTLNANLDPWQAQFVNALVQSGRPLINVAAYNPYDLMAYPQLGTYLVTYENTPPAFTAAARVLFGETPARGRLPVSLPGLM